MFLSVYLFVSPDIPCPGLPQTFFFAYKMPDLFRKTILTILSMLSVDPAFCERLYLCDFNRGSMHSMEVVQTFNRTLLSDKVLIGCGTSKSRGNSRQNAKISCPCAPIMPSVTRKKKIIVMCYLNSWMGLGRSFAS